MCPVSRAEGIIDIKIGKPGEAPGELFVVFFFAGMEPQIFK